MDRREPETFECAVCEEEHRATDDGDGYLLANCPRRGTILHRRPAEP